MSNQEKEKVKEKEKKYVCVPCDYAFETWREAKSHYSTAHPHVKNTIMKRSTISAKKRIKELGPFGLSPTAPIPMQPVPVESAVKGEARLSRASSESGKGEGVAKLSLANKAKVKEAIERAVSQWFDSMDTEKEIQRAMDKVVSEGKLKGSRKRFEEKLREEIAKIVDEEIMKQWIVSGKLGLILELMGASTSTSTSKAESNLNEALKTDLLHKIQEPLKPKTMLNIENMKLSAKELWDEWDRRDREEKRFKETPSAAAVGLTPPKIMREEVMLTSSTDCDINLVGVNIYLMKGWNIKYAFPSPHSSKIIFILHRFVTVKPSEKK